MKNTISIVIFFASLILSFLPEKVHADGLNSFGDHAIAGTIKNFAKAYAQTADLEKIKTKHIKSLSKMSEAKFQKRFSGVYDTLKGLPLGLRTQYGLKKHMTKEEIIRKIRPMDKKSIIEIIDAIPDEVIIKFVKDYLHRTYQAKDQIFMGQIDSLWKEIIQKV